MDKETAISQIYQILEMANISVETLIEIIKPEKPQKKSNKK